MMTNEREILIYYNPESGAGKRTIAHAMSISDHIRTFTLDKLPSTNTSWKQILDALSIHPKDLMNQATPAYREHVEGRDFDDEGWLNILRENPELLRAPIAVRGRKAVLCESPTDIHQLVDTEKDSARKEQSPP